MHAGSKLLAVIAISMFLSVNVQAMVQEPQEHMLKKHELIRIFPQVHLEELALMALTNPSARNMYFMELIYEGIVENNIRKVQSELEWELKRNFDINFKDYLGNTLLHHAVVVHNGDSHNIIIPLLIKNGADVNSRNETGSTPLCVAAMLGKVGAAKQLLAYGAQVNLKDNSDWSPLEYAIIIDGGVPMVQLLLKIPEINFNQKTIIEALNQRAKRIEHLKNIGLKVVTEVSELKELFSYWIASFNQLNYMFGSYFSNVSKGPGKIS